jgi:UDP-N-acetylmuramate dehydrogenase
MQKLFNKLAKSTKAHISLNEPMSRHTTFKIGGPADILIIPQSIGDLKKSVKIISSEKVPIFTMGNGSNLLVSDDGIRGAVIKIAGAMNNMQFNDNSVKAEAGTFVKKLIYTCAERGLSGLEFFIGIPASLGGALAMNMGSWGSSISRFVKTVTVLTDKGKMIKVSKNGCNFGYRSSGLTKPGWIIAEAELELKKDNPVMISDRQEKILNLKAMSQPIGQMSAGCIFKNPPSDSAGKLIEMAGLKGEKIGDAQISPVHANFIINTGGATAADVMALINRTKGIVFEKYSVRLDIEVKLVGF